MPDQITLALNVEPMAEKIPKTRPPRSRKNAAPATSDEEKYTQRFSSDDHKWFSILAGRDKRSLNSFVYSAVLKAAAIQDPNYLLHPKAKNKG